MAFDMTNVIEIVIGGIVVYYMILVGWAYKKTRKNMENKNSCQN